MAKDFSEIKGEKMKKNILKSFDRRCFIKTSLGGIAFVTIPISFKINSRTAYAKNITSAFRLPRKTTLFPNGVIK